MPKPVPVDVHPPDIPYVSRSRLFDVDRSDGFIDDGDMTTRGYDIVADTLVRMGRRLLPPPGE